MLVPSDDSSIAKDSPASAPLTELAPVALSTRDRFSLELWLEGNMGLPLDYAFAPSIPQPDMAEGARPALYWCTTRHIKTGLACYG